MTVLSIHSQFMHKPPVYKRRNIQNCGSSRIIGITFKQARFQRLVHSVYLIFYIRAESGTIFPRHIILEHTRQMQIRSQGTAIFVIIVVKLQEVTAIRRNCSRIILYYVFVSIVDIQSVTVYLDLFGQQIITHMDTVINQFHISSMRIPCQLSAIILFQLMSHLKHHAVT